MTQRSLPDAVQRLLDERSAARDARDWARADALRDQLAQLGWEPQDSPSGSTARPILAASGPSLDDPAEVAASLQVVAEDHPDDLSRLLRGLSLHPPRITSEVVVVANAPSFELGQVLRDFGSPLAARVVTAGERLGWADARTIGMQQSRGEVTILLDTSLEPTGDFVTPLVTCFDDPTVGLAGPWGVTSEDAREFLEAPPGEVDAIEGYCLAVRREALRAVGGFDRRFRWYRNADLDFSFAVRAAGWRAVRTPPLPLTRHEHRGFAAIDEDERDRLSRRNFYRFLEHWRDRPDLLLHRRDR